MPKPCRNTSNTIPKVNNKTPDKTPIIPVTLIIWPMMISLSVITDLHYRLCGVSLDHLVCPREHSDGHFEAERLRGLEVDQ
jgi:hypothetical protein